MSSFNVPGIPVYLVGPYGFVMYMVPFGTSFTPVYVGGYPMQTAVAVEQPAPEEGLTEEEAEELDAAILEAEAGETYGLTQEELKAGDAFAARVAETRIDPANNAEDAEAYDAIDEHVEREEREQAHVRRLLILDDKTAELYKLLRKKVRLYEEQEPLHKAVVAMEAETDPKVYAKNTKNYWRTWNKKIRVLKEWLILEEAFGPLYDECLVLDPEFCATFNAYVKERHPEDPDRDYRALNKQIATTFRNQIRRDEERRERMGKPAAGKPAPGSEKPAPPAATLADMLAPHLGGGK